MKNQKGKYTPITTKTKQKTKTKHKQNKNKKKQKKKKKKQKKQKKKKKKKKQKKTKTKQKKQNKNKKKRFALTKTEELRNSGLTINERTVMRTLNRYSIKKHKTKNTCYYQSRNKKLAIRIRK